MLHLKVRCSRVEYLTTTPSRIAINNLLNALRPACGNRKKMVIRIRGKKIHDGYFDQDGSEKTDLPKVLKELPTEVTDKKPRKAPESVSREAVGAAVKELCTNASNDIKIKRLSLLYVPSLRKDVEVKRFDNHVIQSMLVKVEGGRCFFSNGEYIDFDDIIAFHEKKARKGKVVDMPKNKLQTWGMVAPIQFGD